MDDTDQGGSAPQRPYDTATMAKNGQRGRVLAQIRQREGVGQRHLGNHLDLSQPDVSRIEREVYGGMPRGFAARYLAAVATIAAARGGACYLGCGCNKQ